MDSKELIRLAKQKSVEDQAKREAPYYLKTIAWFHYLGLLRHNKISPRRCEVTLSDALEAGELEPRILELIPAILIVLPKALKFEKSEIPDDLGRQLELIRGRKPNEDFRGVAAPRYLHWIHSQAMDVANRRINSYRMPRRRSFSGHSIGNAIKEGRLRLSLTQTQLAKKYKVSLRIVRDLEQGKLDASLKATNEILEIFDLKLKIGS